MFSLLITIIAIALVAALALSTLYFGGPIFNEGATRAQIAKIIAQGQQLMGAMELYRAETGAYPNALADLVSANYLKSIPVAQAESNVALSSAMAAAGAWFLASPGQPVLVLTPVDLASCQAYNQVVLGVSGVLQSVHLSTTKQCVGTDVNNLMIVSAKSTADLAYVAADVTAPVQIGPGVSSPIPALTDTTADGWLVVPGAPVASGGLIALYSMGPTPSPGGGGAAGWPIGFEMTSPGMTAPNSFWTEIRNDGSAPASVPGNVVSVTAPFIVASNTCGVTLQVGESCLVQVVFSPTDFGQFYSGFTLNAPELSFVNPSAYLWAEGNHLVCGRDGNDNWVFLVDTWGTEVINGVAVPQLSGQGAPIGPVGSSCI